jgi:hypothetical protein
MTFLVIRLVETYQPSSWCIALVFNHRSLEDVGENVLAKPFWVVDDRMTSLLHSPFLVALD